MGFKKILFAFKNVLMEINYLIVAAVSLAIVVLIIFLIRRNHKDQKEFENEVIQSELKSSKHDDPAT